jgi:hypothetical protein
MSLDMKPRKAPPARKSGGGTLLGLFIGLVIGVIGVAGVVWYINKAPLPFTTTGQQPKLPPPVPARRRQQPLPKCRRSHRRRWHCPASQVTRSPKNRALISTRSCRARLRRFPIPNPRKPSQPRPGLCRQTDRNEAYRDEADRGQSPARRNRLRANRPKPSRQRAKPPASKTAESKAADAKPADSARSKADNTLKEPTLSAGWLVPERE